MPESTCKGVIFDLDGVVTASARVHSAAWKAMFDSFLEAWSERHGRPFEPFTQEDYLSYVDGKPRYKGVESFLASRGIDIPFGDVEDPPERETICGLGNRKNLNYRKIVSEEGVEVFESTVAFIEQLKSRSIKVGVASSSKNTRLILEKTGLEHHFETRVCGVVSQDLGLEGKPEPDIFITAARNLGLLPDECAVVEDAVSGVEAGRRGNFGLVLGVARNIDGRLLLEAGADIVVQDMAQIAVDDVLAWFDRGLAEDGWNLTYHGFLPEEEKLRETMCTVGNGYFGTRGCFECERSSEHHYPGTYIAGVYNRLPTEVHGKTIHNNDLVNCPNWLPIEFAVGAGEIQNPLDMEVLSYRQNLDMRDAVVERTLVVGDGGGRLTRIHSRRIASMDDPHRAAIRFSLTPLNYSARIRFRSTLDGDIINDGVARYRQLASRHLEPVEEIDAGQGTVLHVRTNRSGIDIACSARTHLFVDGQPRHIEKRVSRSPARISETFELEIREGQTATLDKVVSIHTSRDGGGDPVAAARAALSNPVAFDRLLQPHARAWHRLWDEMDIRIQGDRFAQKAVRLHAYHMLCTASPHNTGIDAGMPARGLHGEAYRGHVFWDEIYIFPFFNIHFPEITRALLLYRYRRLDGARKYARENGYAGAMYPWQTADGGDEETQIVHYNPVSGKWGPDLSRRQRHVSIAIFYNTSNYCSSTGDTEFLHEYGAEMMLEIARFWADISTLDDNTGRYHIDGVMGPDEYHEKHPDAPDEKGGLRDNAYTNIMVVWLLQRALDLVETLPPGVLGQVGRKIGFEASETDEWKRIVRKMNVVISDGIIHQFDGYMDLPELDWNHYRQKYGNIRRMDRILKAEQDSPDRYKVTKQADVLMTFYLLAPEDVGCILTDLGHPVEDGHKLLEDNYSYYVDRTSHGSSLSKVVHASIAGSILLGDVMWEWFLEALESDIHDTQGGTTFEGIHCGVMTGTLWVVMSGFAGLTLLDEGIGLEPMLPEHWSRLAFGARHAGAAFHIDITRDKASVRAEREGRSSTVEVKRGRHRTFRPWKATEIVLDYRR